MVLATDSQTSEDTWAGTRILHWRGARGDHADAAREQKPGRHRQGNGRGPVDHQQGDAQELVPGRRVLSFRAVAPSLAVRNETVPVISPTFRDRHELLSFRQCRMCAQDRGPFDTYLF